MHRQLVRLREDQTEFAYVLGKTSEAMDEMMVKVRDFSCEGKQLVTALGDEKVRARLIEQARDVPSTGLAAELVLAADQFIDVEGLGPAHAQHEA